MRRARLLAAAMAWTVGLTPLAAYYHYNHYTLQGVIREKFDLNALPNRTLTFFVAEAADLQYSGTDSFPSVLNQIRQAVLAWNVPQSDLRVAFGGLTNQAAPQATPHGMVVFEDLPPGVLAYSSRTVGEPVTGPDGGFVPIVQGKVHLNRNLDQKPGPSYLEAFFTTVVHETGHALGLQHTYTSSAMSTAVTRTTTRMKPIEADDIAALYLLYPNRSMAGSFGSITGRVTSNGTGVHLASVVALRPAGSAVSTLTNQDGTYRIDGLPSDTYWVYVHPLPPNPDMQWPKDAGGQPMLPSAPFGTLFYPGTRDPGQFAAIPVAAGGTVEAIDFSVQQRASAAIYDVAAYSYIGQNAVTPAYLNTGAPMGTVVARGAGLTSGAFAAPGLNAQVLGGSVNIYYVEAYNAPNTWLAMFASFAPEAGRGPRHLYFTLPDDAYVLPSAIQLVNRPAPLVTAATGNPDGTVTVTGAGMNGDSRVLFDGVQAAVRIPFAEGEQGGAIVVAPPPGASQQAATVAVYNSDGQNSMLTQAQDPPRYQYGFKDPAFATVTPNALPAGQSAMVEVNGFNTEFVDGQTTLGFGTGDIHVRRIWVLSPTRLIANVTVAAKAEPPAAPLLTVMSGFQLFTQPFGFQVQAANPQLPAISLPPVNSFSPDYGIYPGAIATVNGANLALSPTGTAVTLNDQPAQVLSATAERVTFVVPAGLRTGPAVLRLNNGVENAYPVAVQIEPEPPRLNGVLNSANQPLDSARPAQAGDILHLLVSNLDPSLVTAPSRLQTSVGGARFPATSIMPFPGLPGVFLAQIILGPAPSGLQVAVTVSVDGGPPSNAFFIPVR